MSESRIPDSVEIDVSIADALYERLKPWVLSHLHGTAWYSLQLEIRKDKSGRVWMSDVSLLRTTSDLDGFGAGAPSADELSHQPGDDSRG